MRNRIARTAAWLVAVALLTFVVIRANPMEVLRAVRLAAPWTVPALAALIGVVYLADSLAMWRVFGWFVTRLSFREVLLLRGAGYILAVLNYALGQGTIVYFVNRTRGVPVSRGTAAVLLIMGSNILLLLFITTLGLPLAHPIPRGLPAVVAVAYAGLAVYIAAVAVRPRWLTERPIFDVLLGAGVGGHARAVAVRIPHLLSLMIFTYVSLRAFGVHIPVTQVALCLPIVYFISVLPISPLGLGTTQLAMTFFFDGYAPAATIIAASLASQAIAIAGQALIGLACLRSQMMARDLPTAPTSPPLGTPG